MELDIDQSHLPRVQEAHTESAAGPESVKHTTTESGAKGLCQGFAVLEDGALAYNLQEQEIEQYYSSNVQKNQLVQNDIRMAKQLQDEEQQRANRVARQLEERDSEYARRIQEEIQRCAEEARRREEEDEEMAKRLQEEEEMDNRRQRLDSGCYGDSNDILPREESAGVPRRLRPRRPIRRTRPSPTPSPSPDSSLSEGETRLPPTYRGRSPGSHSDSDSAEPLPEHLSPVHRNNCAPQQGSRQTDALRLIKNLLQESLGPAYNVEEEVVLRPPFLPAHRLQNRLNTAPAGQHGHDRYAEEGSRYSFSSSVREGGSLSEGWEERERVAGSRRNGGRVGRWHSNSYHGDRRWGEEDYHSNEARSQYRVNSRHVHFQDDRRRYNSYQGDNRRGTATGSSSRNSFSDRGVPGRRSCYGDSRQAPQRGSQGNRNIQTVGAGGNRHLSEVLLRNGHARRSYHGDFRDRRRDSGRDDRRSYGDQNMQSGQRMSYQENPSIQEDRVSHRGDYHYSRSGQDHRDRGGREEGSHGHRWWREEEGGAGRDRHGDRRVRRSASERLRPSVEPVPEPEPISEEEGRWRGERRRSEGGLREERSSSGGVRRSISFSGRSPPPTAGPWGAGVTPRRDGASLELGELGQVLQDEELARRLQEEEEQLLRMSPTSPRDPDGSSPRGDFRVAQVAQDEEIARFIQRSERKAQRQSSDPEGQGSRREPREPDNGEGSRQKPWDPDDSQERSPRPRRMELPQGSRQRLDSQGLNSPAEDLSPDCQPSSPNSAASQLQTVRNIAEELDPTFKAKRRDSHPAAQGSTGLSTSPSSPSGLHDYPQEPAFVPPTKRQSDKSARPKAKGKKESCKQQ